MPLKDGLYAYGCTTSNNCMWVYEFLTKVPAKGEGFFPKSLWKFATNFADLPLIFVNCGRLSLVKNEVGWCLEQPVFITS